MTVELTFEFWVESQFYWTGQLPIALMEEIGRHKVEMYEALRAHPLEPDMLAVEKVFTVQGHRFQVLFAADGQRLDASSNKRQLRVAQIEKLS